MIDPLLAAIAAVSDKSPAIKTALGLAAQRIIALEAKSAPVPPAVFAQNYSPAAMTALLTAGDLVRVAADRLTPTADDVCRFEVRAGDVYSNWSGERSQIQLPNVQGSEGERWTWQFKVLLDPAFQFAGGFYNVLFEHHHQGSTGSPPLTLQLHAGRWVVRQTNTATPGNDWTEYDVAAATPGAWQGIRVDCLLSVDPAKATTAVSVDAYTRTVTGKPNLYTGSNVYPMWGLYRAPSPLTQVVSFGPMVRL
jgi:hypothetical protein